MIVQYTVPVSTLEVLVRMLRRGTAATDFGLSHIVLGWFEKPPADPDGGK